MPQKLVEGQILLSKVNFPNPLSSADMHDGKKSKQSIYRFLYHHPLITQLKLNLVIGLEKFIRAQAYHAKNEL